MSNQTLKPLQKAINNDGQLAIPDNYYSTFDVRPIFSQQQSEATRIIDKVCGVVSTGAYGDILIKSQEKDTRYVVNMSSELKLAIDKGLVKLDTSKTGEVFAQIRDASGHYGEKLSITKELIAVGLNPAEVAQACQLKAIEEKLGEMLDMLTEIGCDVAEVIQGQHNDRIGLYNSGLTLFLESRTINDNMFKSLVAAQALKTLSDGNEQLLQDMRTNIQYLLGGEYKKKKGRSSEDIQEKMLNINRCFDVVHRCFLLKAALFYERKEISAMLSVFDEYRKFLQNEIIPYAPQLIEFDSSDILLENGRWESRVALFEEIGKMKAELATSNTYSLEMEAVAHG